MAVEPLDLGLALISKVIEVCQNVSANKGTARALGEQWRRTRDCIARASSEERSSYTRSLKALQELAEETMDFLRKFRTKSLMRKAWSHSSDKEKFVELGSRLNMLIQEMQLGCVFDTAELLSTHETDIEDIERLVAASEARAAATLESTERKLLAAIQSAEAQHQGVADPEAVARAVKAQVADALAQQARAYAEVVGAQSEDDQAEVRRIILSVKEEMLAQRPPPGVSEAALGAALAVAKNDLDAHFDRLGSEMKGEMKGMEARLLDAMLELKVNNRESAPGKKPRRESMTAKLEELRPEDVKTYEVIGEGFFGQVYRGRYQSKWVALKRLKNMAALSGRAIDRFKREAAVMQKLNHPCIVHIWGVCSDPTNAFICVELGDKTLTKYLYSKAGGGGDKIRELMLVSLLENVSCALAFTHQHGICHRDIKPDNVLLVKEASAPGGLAAKLTDFGLAKVKDGSSFSFEDGGGEAGTCAYMAPETFGSGNDDEEDEEEAAAESAESVGESAESVGGGGAGQDKKKRGRVNRFKADMYSFAVLTYEAYAGRVPFRGLSIVDVITRVKVEGERPGPVPTNAPGSVQEVIRRSWCQDPRDRPHAKQVSKVLAAELNGQRERAKEHRREVCVVPLAVSPFVKWLAWSAWRVGLAACLRASLSCLPDLDRCRTN